MITDFITETLVFSNNIFLFIYWISFHANILFITYSTVYMKDKSIKVGHFLPIKRLEPTDLDKKLKDYR